MATFEENQTTLETLGEGIEATESIEFADDKANDTTDTPAPFTVEELRISNATWSVMTIHKMYHNPKRKEIDFTGIHILLAEDNEMNMEIAVDILQKSGFTITQARDGQEVVDKFVGSEPGTYQVILMDIQLPVRNGYEATKIIRNSNHLQAAAIPIIAMTANAFAEDVNEAYAAGMNDHVSKPIDYDKLLNALQKITDNSGDERNE